MNRLLAAVCDAEPYSFVEAVTPTKLSDLVPHEPAAAIAIYGCLAVLVIVPLVILVRKKLYKDRAWWNRNNDYIEKFPFRHIKSKEDEHRRY